MGSEMCIRDRHGRLLRILSHIYDIIVLSLYNSPLYTNSGSFVAFKTKYVQNLPWFKNDHRYLPLIVIHRGGNKITEVMTRHRLRKHGKSNYPKLKKIIFGPFEIMRFILRLKTDKYAVVDNQGRVRLSRKAALD